MCVVMIFWLLILLNNCVASYLRVFLVNFYMRRIQSALAVPSLYFVPKQIYSFFSYATRCM